MTAQTKPTPVVVPRASSEPSGCSTAPCTPLTGGRFGLRTPKADRWGMLRLRTVGRRTGKERVAIVGYIEDGANLVTPAMNGWAEPEPAWWLNLQANPDAIVELPGGRRAVTARAANEDERRRLWAEARRSRQLGVHRRQRRAAITGNRDRHPGAPVRRTTGEVGGPVRGWFLAVRLPAPCWRDAWSGCGPFAKRISTACTRRTRPFETAARTSRSA